MAQLIQNPLETKKGVQLIEQLLMRARHVPDGVPCQEFAKLAHILRGFVTGPGERQIMRAARAWQMRAFTTTADLPEDLRGLVGMFGSQLDAMPDTLYEVFFRDVSQFVDKGSIKIGQRDDTIGWGLIAEGEEIRIGKITGSVTSAKVPVYASGFGITRQAIWDRDVQAISDAARVMKRKYYTFRATIVYSLLEALRAAAESASQDTSYAVESGAKRERLLIKTINQGFVDLAARMTAKYGAQQWKAYLLAYAGYKTDIDSAFRQRGESTSDATTGKIQYDITPVYSWDPALNQSDKVLLAIPGEQSVKVDMFGLGNLQTVTEDMPMTLAEATGAYVRYLFAAGDLAQFQSVDIA